MVYYLLCKKERLDDIHIFLYNADRMYMFAYVYCKLEIQESQTCESL